MVDETAISVNIPEDGREKDEMAKEYSQSWAGVPEGRGRGIILPPCTAGSEQKTGFEFIRWSDSSKDAVAVGGVVCYRSIEELA